MKTDCGYPSARSEKRFFDKEEMMNCSRRGFVGGIGALAGAGLASSAAAAASGAGKDGEGVRFLAFADIHYSVGNFWPNADREWLERILKRAVDEKVDFVMSLGDMTFGMAHGKVRDYVRWYNGFKPVKTYHTLGNHEFESTPPETVDEVFGLKCGYYSYDVKGFRFIVLDPHYHLKDGRLERYSKRCSYPEEKVWCVLPPEEIAWLRKTVLTSPYPCVVFIHESIEPECGCVYNRSEALAVFAEANTKRPGTVRLVVNGHTHKDHFRMLDGVAYLDLNSASYDIYRKHNAYPEEFRRRCGSAECILTWNDPLSAVITLTPDGGLKIDGAKSSFYLGVTPEMARWTTQSRGMGTVPWIQSVSMKIDYI
jgi:predicted phosphodiesterase